MSSTRYSDLLISVKKSKPEYSGIELEVTKFNLNPSSNTVLKKIEKLDRKPYVAYVEQGRVSLSSINDLSRDNSRTPVGTFKGETGCIYALTQKLDYQLLQIEIDAVEETKKDKRITILQTKDRHGVVKNKVIQEERARILFWNYWRKE